MNHIARGRAFGFAQQRSVTIDQLQLRFSVLISMCNLTNVAPRRPGPGPLAVEEHFKCEACEG
jgi:hypothetical protein